MKINCKLIGLSALVLLLIASAIPRFCELGSMDTRSDEIELMQFMQSGISARDYLLHEIAAFKAGRQMPLPRAAVAVLIRSFRLSPTLFAIRLPFAVCGLLSMLALFLLGREAGDDRLAWILAFLGAINPYLLYWSKVAHVYAFPMCFFTFAAAAFSLALREVARGSAPNGRNIAWFAVSSVFACYSHMSAWPAVALLWVALIWFLFRRKERRTSAWRPVGLGFGALALSLLPWVIIFISALFTAKESFLPPDADIPTQFRRLALLPCTMTWGSGWRALFSVGLPLAAVVAGIVQPARRARTLFICLGSLLVFLLLFAMQYIAAGSFDSVRYYTPVWTSLMLLSGMGIAVLGELLSKASRRAGGWLWQGLMSVLLGLAMLKPLIATATLPAPSIPYSKINTWMDANLPKGAPVLVDRWFEPWNEMAFHSPSNVFATFTIPDEPVEQYLQYRWRESAMEFFRKYPDAAYLELTKHYFHVPQVGFWTWPRQYFRRHLAFTNEQALALARLNMMPEPFAASVGSNTNRVIVELFYNTARDSVQAAKERGDSLLLLYSSGWGYTKLWQLIEGDFRDWRVLGREAALEIHNLTDASLDIRVHILGAALPGSKSIQSSSGSSFRFAAQQLSSWSFVISSVSPGPNRLVLWDPAWAFSQSSLLINELSVAVESNETASDGGR